METCKSTLFVISLLFLVTNIGCKDSCDGIDTSPQTITYLIEEDAKAKFPFKDKDTQIYISNLGDTAVLFGKLYTGYETNNSSRMVECSKPITTHGEKMSYYANGNNPELNLIEFKLRAKIERSGENVINFRINGNIPNAGEYGYFNLSPEYINNVNNYTDSIMVNGNYIYGKTLTDPKLISFLYNFKYGFLKIEFVSGKIWTKII
jgi:hypothetical protein